MSFAARQLGGASISVAWSQTITEGTSTFGGGFSAALGFDNGYNTVCGSVPSASVAGGLTLKAFADYNTAGPSYGAYIVVTGFTSDPGASWLYDATVGGTTKLGSTATYSYSAGQAVWLWSSASSTIKFGFAASGTISAQIRRLA